MPSEDAPMPKRRRLENEEPRSANAEARLLRRGIASLNRSVSPPARRQATASQLGTEARATKKIEGTAVPLVENKVVPSPFQLTRIRDLPAAANVDTVGIEHVLRDPLITETWVFNYMFDVDWLMSCLDDDTRDLTKVKVIHGNWKREDPQKLRMEAWAQQYPNLEVITAYMPEPYGTHHSKMLINFRADDTAQVIIHTANMIPQDWTNMSQAVWRSPLLPLSKTSQSQESHPIGSGERFGSDLHAYLSAYGAKLRPLATRLALHDFSSVHAALVASAPGRVKLNECESGKKTAWGWVGLQQVLAARPRAIAAKGKGKQTQDTEGMVVAQVSSIASLGATDRWLQHFHSILSTSTDLADSKPVLRIIFPTPNEIRRSLDGYESGGSIHTKTQANATQKKQADYLRPYLCRWDSTPTANAQTQRSGRSDAKRGTAAPHVKTYIRFSQRVDEPAEEDITIDWALLTSANLSTQAWGAMATEPSGSGSKKKRTNQRDQVSGGASGGEVRICSWEIGVCVWPELFAACTTASASAPTTPGSAPAAATAVMTPAFATDRPAVERKLGDAGRANPMESALRVGLRLPYSLPLKPYERDDEMWCATQPCQEVDRHGRVWGGF